MNFIFHNQEIYVGHRGRLTEPGTPHWQRKTITKDIQSQRTTRLLAVADGQVIRKLSRLSECRAQSVGCRV